MESEGKSVANGELRRLRHRQLFELVRIEGVRHVAKFVAKSLAELHHIGFLLPGVPPGGDPASTRTPT